MGARGEGVLVAFCGIDGCGKTTQLKLAEEWLADRGFPVLVTRQPTDFYRRHPKVRNFFRTNVPEGGMETLVLLSALDRQHHLRTVVQPALSAGRIVLCDRYYYSAEAFFFARGVDRKVVRRLNPEIPMPALTVYLDVPAAICHQRILKRDGKMSSVEERSLLFLEKVRDGFDGAADASFLRIDGLQDIDSIHQLIVERLAESLNPGAGGDKERGDQGDDQLARHGTGLA